MAEEKKRGFHALEQRIHQMEEEDAKKEKAASGQREAERARTEPAEQQKQRK